MADRRNTGGHIVSDLGVLVKRGVRFSTILADPPWRFENTASRGAAERHYQTMTLDEIASLPVPNLAADACHLHLWHTVSFAREARLVLQAWGFEEKGLFVWVKNQLGCGNYWRVGTELMLLGIKGGLPFQDHAIPNFIIADRGEHSAKPEQIRLLIERVSPPPYLELFGRKPVCGWRVFGNQIRRGLFDDDIEPIYE